MTILSAKVPHNNISMISVSQGYVEAQKEHIEGATYCSLFNLNSASKKSEIKQAVSLWKRKVHVSSVLKLKMRLLFILNISKND